MPLKRLVPIPGWYLNTFNSTVQTGMTEPITGLELPSGLCWGDYFDLTDSEAAAYSNPSGTQLRNGRYRLIQVDSGAVAATIKTGTIGVSVAGRFAANPNVVTSYDGIGAINAGRFCVFLNAVTPGNFGFVQEAGYAWVLGSSSISSQTAGSIMVATTGGLVTSSATVTALYLGTSVENAPISSLFKVLLDVPTMQN